MELAPGGERPGHGIDTRITKHAYADWRLIGTPGLQEWADLAVKRALIEALRRNRRASDEGCRP